MNEAMWSGNLCTWKVRYFANDIPGSITARRGPAGANLYDGAAGVGLFLTELYAVTREEKVVRTAEGALRYAFGLPPELPLNSIGMFVGQPGLSYALARLAAHTGQNEFVDAAEECVQRTEQQLNRVVPMDLVGGLAGAVVALLHVWRWVGSEAALRLAHHCGGYLLDNARKWPRGWSWGPAHPRNRRHLTGLAHGASGCALSLLELYRTTQHGQYQHAAELALAYESQFLDERGGFWEDVRDANELPNVKHVFEDSTDSVVVPPHTSTGKTMASHATTWCYGTSGIGLVRIHAYRTLGSERWLREALIAINTCLRENVETASYCLCHGVFGNDAILVSAARTLNMPELLDTAFERARNAVDAFQASGKEWPSGLPYFERSFTLMQGDAGIGYHLLSLCDSELPSVLLPHLPYIDGQRGTIPEIGEPSRIRDLYVETYFGGSLEAFENLGISTDSVYTRAAQAVAGEEIAAAKEALMNSVSKHVESEPLLLDASRVDLEVLAAMQALDDFSDWFRAERERPHPSSYDWSVVRMQLRASVRLVVQEFEWARWIQDRKTQSADKSSALPKKARTVTLLFQQGDQIIARRLSHFAALVLFSATRSTTVEESCDYVTELVGGSSNRDQIRNAVRQQLIHAYTAGLLAVFGTAATA